MGLGSRGWGLSYRAAIASRIRLPWLQGTIEPASMYMHSQEKVGGDDKASCCGQIVCSLLNTAGLTGPMNTSTEHEVGMIQVE